MGVTAAKGFLASGLHAGIKKSGKPDMALVVSARLASAAGVFTVNRFRAAPVGICIERLRQTGGRARAIIATSGCANAMTGQAGRKDALELTREAARELRLEEKHVLIASTGAIGTRMWLPLDVARRAIHNASGNLGCTAAAGLAAAGAIMTTDTKPKQAVARFHDGATALTVGGMAKGVGMVSPKMATVLVFVTTDAEVSPARLKTALAGAVGPTLNSISVDGQMSTNDTCLVLANGAASTRPLTSGGYRKFAGALREVLGSLARQLVADGEGATRLIEVAVRGAKTPAEARLASRAVGDSMLVKTAIYGEQANWGRIVQALGACEGLHFRPASVEVRVGGHPAIRGGLLVPVTPAIHKVLHGKMVRIEIDLKAGRYASSVLTCDLTEGYIKENAGYLS
jgi:glutamate N-acetyltransferase/amino-acid N-acetyltransferase